MRTLILIACALAPTWLAAEVLDSSASGFTVKETLTIQAAPQAVYDKVFHIGEWWNPAHTFSQDSHNLSLDAKAGGCLCEKLPNGGSAKHMDVVRVAPGSTIVLHGALGPMQTMAVSGSMLIQLTPAGGATKLEITYAVAGYSANGMSSLAGVVDTVLLGQFTRLKNFIEHGDPAAK
jgi:uncharacterized protein YndB with AHSA1/START domain